MTALRGVDFRMYVLSVIIQTTNCIKKRHNSCKIDLPASIFQSFVQCLMVKVWCKFDQNWTKAVDVIEQKP